MRQLKLVCVLIVIVMVSAAFSISVSAGDLDPSAAPGPTMHSLEDIYQLQEDIYNIVYNSPTPPADTGQTISYAAGDDGDLEMGADWPDPRFTDNGDGTVTDNLTQLIWLKSASCFGGRSWADALSDSGSLANGACGLSDGSAAGDWRLPNIRELQSLVDYGNNAPALPTGHPFSGVNLTYSWSGTTYVANINVAWVIPMNDGISYTENKVNSNNVWPVRGGN